LPSRQNDLAPAATGRNLASPSINLNFENPAALEGGTSRGNHEIGGLSAWLIRPPIESLQNIFNSGDDA
jgi:hypothetical protein